MAGPKEDVFDIGEFLARQASKGDIESHGEFTVSQEKAAQKLGRLAFPFDYAWVLKIVQAAVAWKATRIEVRQYRAFTVFAFLPEDFHQFPTEERLVSTLLSGRVFDQEPLPLFCHGLRGLVEQAGLSFRLILNTGQRVVRPIHAGRHVSALAEEERLVRLAPAPGVRLLVAHLSFNQFFMSRYVPRPLLIGRPDLRIVEALDRYCFLCPIPLIVDGRRVDRLLTHPQWGFRKDRRPIALIPLKCPALPPLRAPEEFEEKLIAVQTHPLRAQRSYGGNREGNVWLYLEGSDPPRRTPKTALDRIDHSQSRLHSLLFVSHGVVVERYTTSVATRHVAMMIIAGADGWDTDLSGLSLIRSEALDEASKSATHLAGQCLLELAAVADVFINDEPDGQSPKDSVDYQLASESHRLAEEVVGKRFPSLKTGLAAVLFAKRWFTSSGSDPAPLEDMLAFGWLAFTTQDFEELETIETARFEASAWLTER